MSKKKKKSKKALALEAVRATEETAAQTRIRVLKDCVEKIFELMARVELLEKRSGLPGPTGPQGRQGEKGETGGFSLFG